MSSFKIEYCGRIHRRSGADANAVATDFISGLLRDGILMFDEFFHVYPERSPKSRSWVQTSIVLENLGMISEPVREDGSDWLQIVE